MEILILAEIDSFPKFFKQPRHFEFGFESDFRSNALGKETNALTPKTISANV